MSQTWENREEPDLGLNWKNGKKKPNFRPDFGSFEFYLYWMLEIVWNYHCMQFYGKLIIQTQENGKKPHFKPNIGSFGSNLGSRFFQKSGFISH